MTYYTVSKPSTTYYEAFRLAIKTWKALSDQDLITWAQLNALGLTTWKSLTNVISVTFYYTVSALDTAYYVASAPAINYFTVPLPTTTYYEVSV